MSSPSGIRRPSPPWRRRFKSPTSASTPSNDGKVIRLVFPELTEERRKELVKVVRKKGEESKVAIRSIRRDANEQIKKQQKDNELTEDDLKRLEEKIQKLTDELIREIDTIVSDKEKEILSV